MTLLAGENPASTVKRQAMAAWRKALGAGDLTLPDMLRERPDCLAHRSVLDLLTMGRRWEVRRAAKVNACAIRCGVNLAVPLADLTPDETEWLVDVLEQRRYQNGKRTPQVVHEQRPVKTANYRTGARWLDGPRFAEWLRRYLPEPMGWAQNIGHYCRERELAGATDFYKAEHHLVSLGLHGDDVPDECWLPQAPWEDA